MNFSVVIPTRNRPALLRLCLESFFHLNYPPGEWELIIVNDGGEDWQTAVPQSLLSTLPIQMITIPTSGPAAARNAGAAQARGRFLAFTDDDCEVTPDWLSQLAKGFDHTGADGIGGRTINPAPNYAAAEAGQTLIDFLTRYLSDEFDRPTLLVSNNAAYRRSVFLDAGGFDSRFHQAAAEDWELGLRMSDRGAVLACWPNAKVYHHHKLGWLGHCQQQFRYGRGGALLDRGRIGKSRKVNRPRFSIALANYLWENRTPLRIWGIIGLGQVSYWLGKTREQHNIKEGNRVPETAVPGQ